MKTQIKLAFAASVLVLISACGQRGPLYIPESEPAPNNTPSASVSISTALLKYASLSVSVFDADWNIQEINSFGVIKPTSHAIAVPSNRLIRA